jgi:hypothetical protein
VAFPAPPADSYCDGDCSVICRSLLWSAAGHAGGPHRTTERTIAPSRRADITLYG